MIKTKSLKNPKSLSKDQTKSSIKKKEKKRDKTGTKGSF
jgi:hypothetical protein